MKISECLAKADFVCSFIPGLSTLTNTVDMIALTILKISKSKSSNPYVKELKEKGYLGCAICAVPFGLPALFAVAFIKGAIESLKKNQSSKSFE